MSPLRPSGVELRRRLPRLLLGLVLCGAGVALMVRAGLGLPPWEGLHQGISNHLGIGIGWCGIGVGVIVMLAWIPLREVPGLGTILNVLVIGTTVQVLLPVIPTHSPLGIRVAEMALGALLFGPGIGLYIGAGLGPGPRDGIMTALSARGMKLARVRTGIELCALFGGWLLGGTIGVGTLFFAFTVGPNAAIFLRRWTLPGLPQRRGEIDGEAELPVLG